MRGITKKQFAAQQKVSPARVSQWVKSGVISTLPDGSIDPIEGERDLLRNRDASKRLDWEASYPHATGKNFPVADRGDGQPPPYTGHFIRDTVITCLGIFYDYHVSIMGPLYFKLLREVCHVSKESAEDLTILFAFKCHEIIKEFLEKDVFDQWLRKNEGVNLDKLQGELLGKAIPKTFPPRDFSMDHPAFILELLKAQRKREGKVKC